MTDLPLVTVLVPARDEAADIDACLEAIAAQDYPRDRIEVVVVDGSSSDGTAAIAERRLAGLGLASLAVLGNPEATTPSNLNFGLARAHGKVLCRVDARTRIESHYVRTCVEVLSHRPDVSVIGGAQIALARDGTAKAVGIARALNNRWAMGGSRYRFATTSGESDTVYLGAFRRGDLQGMGGWNERLVTNQDFELNRRMAQIGKVWFDASLRSGYVPRSSLTELWWQYVRFGRAKVRYWTLTRARPERRQILLVFLPAVAATGVALVPPAVRRAIVLGGVAAIVVAGELGTDEPAATGWASRAWAAASSVVVAGGWVGGVWYALVAQRVRRTAG